MMTLKNILVATDFSEPSDAALATAGNWPAVRRHAARARREHVYITTFARKPTPPSHPLCRRRSKRRPASSSSGS